MIAYIVSNLFLQSQVAMDEAKVEKVKLEEAALAEMERELEIRLWIGGEIVKIGYDRQKIVEMVCWGWSFARCACLIEFELSVQAKNNKTTV